MHFSTFPCHIFSLKCLIYYFYSTMFPVYSRTSIFAIWPQPTTSYLFLSPSQAYLSQYALYDVNNKVILNPICSIYFQNYIMVIYPGLLCSSPSVWWDLLHLQDSLHCSERSHSYTYCADHTRLGMVIGAYMSMWDFGLGLGTGLLSLGSGQVSGGS